MTHICRIITKAGHAGDLPTALAGLSNDEPAARVAALGAVHRLEALTTERLAVALEDPSPEVRYRAVELTARTATGAELAPKLIECRSDPALSEVAAFALGELDLDAAVRADAVEVLGRQATEHADALCRESAVAALGALGGGLAFILAATADVATVRRRAVLALAPFEGPEVERALTAASTDRDWQVRQAAEDLIGPT